MLHCNQALSLDVESHIFHSNQIECFISMQKSDATLKSVYDINSGNCNASLITTMTLDWSSSSSFEHTIISAMPEVIRIMILDKKTQVNRLWLWYILKTGCFQHKISSGLPSKCIVLFVKGLKIKKSSEQPIEKPQAKHF